MKRFILPLALVLLTGCAQRTVTVKMGTVTICRQCKAVIKDETQTVTAHESEKHKYAVNTVQSLCAKCAQPPVVQTPAPAPARREEPPIMNVPPLTNPQRSSSPQQFQRSIPPQSSQQRSSDLAANQFASLLTSLDALRTNIQNCGEMLMSYGSLHNFNGVTKTEQWAQQLEQQALQLYVQARNLPLDALPLDALSLKTSVTACASDLKEASKMLRSLADRYDDGFTGKAFYSLLDSYDEERAVIRAAIGRR
jgi:hypothetical protein